MFRYIRLVLLLVLQATSWSTAAIANTWLMKKDFLFASRPMVTGTLFNKIFISKFEKDGTIQDIKLFK